MEITNEGSPGVKKRKRYFKGSIKRSGGIHNDLNFHSCLDIIWIKLLYPSDFSSLTPMHLNGLRLYSLKPSILHGPSGKLH